MNKWTLSLAASTARLLPDWMKKGIYCIPPLARFIRRGLNQAAPQGITQITIAAGANAGMQMLLDMQSEKDYWLGTYEPELQHAIANLIQPGMVIYDVGANIGYISLMLARAAGEDGSVFSFEALPANLERLRANLTLNPEGKRARVVAAAVIDHDGPAHFLLGPSGGMGKAEGSAGRSAQDDHVAYTETITVAGLSLDSFVYQQGQPAPQAVKMDIEGGEILALPGMQRLLKDARPILLMELHGPQAASLAWETLSAAGYRICQMTPGYPTVTSVADLDWKAYLVALP